MIAHGAKGQEEGSCCPEESWNQLEADANYQERGIIEKVDDIEIYR